MSKGYVFALKGLVSVFCFGVFVETARAQETAGDDVLIVLKTGDQMIGKIDARSDGTTLWLRIEGESTIVLRSVRATGIRRITAPTTAVGGAGRAGQPLQNRAERRTKLRTVQKTHAELAVEWLGLTSGFLSHR